MKIASKIEKFLECVQNNVLAAPPGVKGLGHQGSQKDTGAARRAAKMAAAGSPAAASWI